MHVAARTHLTAGVALIGASAIALTPITVTPSLPGAAAPPVPVVATPYGLTTATNPFVAFGELIGNTGASLDATAANFLANPFPILRSFGENQVANFAYMSTAVEMFLTALPTSLEQVGAQVKDIFADISAGNFIAAGEKMVGAVVTLFFPVAGPIYAGVQILNHTAKNIAAAAQTFSDNFVLTMLSVLGPFNAFIQSGGHVAQTVSDAFKEGDIGAAIGAILSAPLVQLDALLNGFRSGEFSFAPGVFTVGSNPFEDGPISAIFGLFKKIADAITPIPPVEAAAALAPTDSADPGAVPQLTDAATITVSAESDFSAGDVVGAELTPEKSAEAPAEPVSTPPAEPVDEVPAPGTADVDEDADVVEEADVVDDGDIAVDGGAETPTATDDDDASSPTDEGPGDSDSGNAGGEV